MLERGKKMLENDSRIFSVRDPPGCWLWMAVVESSVKLRAQFTTIIVIVSRSY